MPSLSCDHCGNAAISSDENWFTEDDGEACGSCGFPGHVDVDTTLESAWWASSDDDDAVCSDAGCEDCRERRMMR